MRKSGSLDEKRFFSPGSFSLSLKKKKTLAPRRRVLTSSVAPLVDSQEAGLERYAIAGKEADWSDALVGGKGPKSGLLSVKRKAAARGDAETPAEEKKDRKERKAAASAGKKSKGGGKKKR